MWTDITLSRVNIGQARTAGLETDLHLVRNQYDIALTVGYVENDETSGTQTCILLIGVLCIVSVAQCHT